MMSRETTIRELLDLRRWAKYGVMFHRDGEMIQRVCDDALAQIRPRMLSLKELRAYLMADKDVLTEEEYGEIERRTPVYTEHLIEDDIKRHWSDCVFMRVLVNEEWFAEGYNVRFRCWTAKPTQEEMEEAIWDVRAGKA